MKKCAKCQTNKDENDFREITHAPKGAGLRASS